MFGSAATQFRRRATRRSRAIVSIMPLGEV
jgi:hypothetical protein